MIKVFRKTSRGIVKLTFDYESIKLYQSIYWQVQWGRGFFYLRRAVHTGNGKQKRIHFHRELMNLADYDGKTVVDHINGDSLDNRVENLRICTQKDNIKNFRIRDKSKTSSKYQGVYYNKKNKNWRSIIRADNKQIEVGSFKSEIEAAEAYNEAIVKYKGEFSVLNEIHKKLKEIS